MAAAPFRLLPLFSTLTDCTGYNQVQLCFVSLLCTSLYAHAQLLHAFLNFA